VIKWSLTTFGAVLLSLCAPGISGAGTIYGEVKFIDVPPKLAPVVVSKDQDYCGEFLPNETYAIDGAGGLKNVVVFLDAALPIVPANPQKLNVIDNTGCRYAPRIFAMQKGERLQIRNKDPKLHIPHAMSGRAGSLSARSICP